MTLEVLFAQQGQAETFLRMVLCGAGVAVLLSLGRLCRKKHLALLLWDVLLSGVLTLLVAGILLDSGAGLRLYALLGLLLGALLYETGLRQLLLLLRKIAKKRRRSAGMPEGYAE